MDVNLSPSNSLLSKSQFSGGGSNQSLNPFATVQPKSVTAQVNPFSGSTSVSTSAGTSTAELSTNPFQPATSTRSVLEQTRLTLFTPGFAVDQPNRLLYTSSLPDISLVCFCVLDENSGQQPDDRPSFFQQTMIERFPEFGEETKHIIIHFRSFTDLFLLEPVDNENTFLVEQPPVDGYDWFARIDELVGPLNSTNTLMVYCIDDSGSMSKSDVAESIALFEDRTKDFAIPPVEITMDPVENMYLPFLREDVLTLIGEQSGLI